MGLPRSIRRYVALIHELQRGEAVASGLAGRLGASLLRRRPGSRGSIWRSTSRIFCQNLTKFYTGLKIDW